MTEPEIVAAMRPVLDAFKNLRVSCYVGGSVASSIYGVARTTLDVDVVADLKLEHARALREILESAYYLDESAIRDAIQHRGSFNLIHLASMLKVDVFVLKAGSYHQQALQRRRSGLMGVESSQLECEVASPEDVILAKLSWFRAGEGVSERQWSDVLGVLKVQQGRLDFSYLRHWAAELELSELLKRAAQESGFSMQ